jgi:hypothetical protein
VIPAALDVGRTARLAALILAAAAEGASIRRVAIWAPLAETGLGGHHERRHRVLQSSEDGLRTRALVAG